ncbi:molybdopterin-dependent oxidoreductase [Sphingobium sp. H39-3-25]|uniref:molybdopterin cofactor-binding domain-containing protein n=1 Tax=Sphingobium arseniciresistens TaxID=3030834 RepID=UPI0023B88C1B|nr:molybdopterin-dependent oxidoreductase [Sphingobium arseniciresistens]
MNRNFAAAGPEELLRGPGVLGVAEQAGGRIDLYLTVHDDGTVTGFNGHVDLGTGIRTSLAQIIAEELDLPLDRVSMVLGDTVWTPDQGPTAASETIQVAAVPLRCAAAQARRWLVARAAERLGLSEDMLITANGRVGARGGDNRTIGYGELVADAAMTLTLDLATPVKDPARYTIVGQSSQRVDLPGKATGTMTYVHDVRMPGMLHGRVVRPPYAGRDQGAFVGRSLIAVDEGSIAHIPGVVKVVVLHDFVGVVAEREDQAEDAARALRVQWAMPDPLPDLDPPTQAILENPGPPRTLRDTGDVDAALAASATRVSGTYVWPFQMHASIGPCCSVAAFDDAGRLTVWSGTQTVRMLQDDLALLLGIPVGDVEIVRLETSGSYGRSGMDDVGADAALLARAVGAPVRVQLSREQEHGWEPKGGAQLMRVEGGLDDSGALAAYDFHTRYPCGMAPTLALLLTRKVEPVTVQTTGGDRSAIPPYRYPSMRVVNYDQGTIIRSAFLRGVSALPNCFAHESFIDELALAANSDPVEFRLRHIDDARAIELVRAVADRAGWTPHAGPRMEQVAPDVVRGRGFAYAVYVHGHFPGVAAAASAWVADVEVNTATGEVAVTKVTVGQDSGMMINPEGVRHQIEGNVLQSTSRSLMERVTFDETAVTNRNWGTYPILKFTEAPVIDVVMMPRPLDPPLGVGESASVPSAAAIANAVFDATGVRFREFPLTPERVRAGLQAQGGGGNRPARPRSSWFAGVLSACAAAGAVAMATLTPTIAPVPPVSPGTYSAETIARGRQVAAAGDCAVCHTQAGGAVNAGGLAIETPFGVVHSTNITPDVATGIGGWSYPAFDRAMRQGISRDGRHLYPAFPYTAFARLSEPDMQALYAWLMAQPPVVAAPKATRLAFPMNLRPLVAGWNALYHNAEPFTPDPARSALWNRGAYLVEGVGHCSACHSPRNALGAEITSRHLAGGMVDGWDAPALGAQSRSPVPWTEEALYQYLRTGASEQHGGTVGPMLAVVAEMAALPDSDIRAMAHYLASRSGHVVSDASARARAQALTQLGRASLAPLDSVGARAFDGACAVCHANDNPDMYGGKVSLALSTTVHADRPDNLIRTILSGVNDPAKGVRGAMPAFADQFNDAQLTDLVRFIRRTQATARPEWQDVAASVRRIRSEVAPRTPR